MHANKRQELDKVYAGDIAAAIGFKFTTTGDTICDEQHPVILESMEFPEPVIELAIEPKQKLSGKTWRISCKTSRRRPDFPCTYQQRDRSDDHRWYGRASFGDHRRQTSP